MYTVGSVLEDLTRRGEVVWNETGEELSDGSHTIKGLQALIGDHLFTIRVVRTEEERGSWFDKALGCGCTIFYALVIENVKTGVSVTYTDDPEVIPGKKDRPILGIMNVDPSAIAWHINGILFWHEKITPETLKDNLVRCLDPELRPPGGGEPKAQ